MAMQRFLDHINLSKYKNLLTGQGYTDEEDIFMLNETDLDSVCITDANDRNTILNAVSDTDISAWLLYYKLQDYEKHFRRLRINSLHDLKQNTMCDDLMNELEVMIPGHRKRLSMAASRICPQLKVKEPVACGYWGKNDAVPTVENDFLWLNKCRIKSNIPGHNPVELLNCLVDTASEVVTVEEKILPELNLNFLQYVKSKGIHIVEEKPLYRGVLLLGNKEIEVEVMPDSYNSIGCNVFQRFSHSIDGQYHYWLESDSQITEESQ